MIHKQEREVIMGDNTHNGWTNYATWRVNLEICDDITSSLVGEQTFDSVDDLAEYLENEVDEVITNYGELKGLAVDYARAFLSDVDWHEIASNADELIESDEVDEDE